MCRARGVSAFRQSRPSTAGVGVEAHEMVRLCLDTVAVGGIEALEMVRLRLATAERPTFPARGHVVPKRAQAGAQAAAPACAGAPSNQP